MSRLAVVVFNLGGPDSLQAVKPFLFNLFNDPAIISVPTPFRWMLATLISTTRAAKARGIYSQIGGRSPLLPETEAQAAALEALLPEGSKVFIAMRYWHPMTAETVAAVKAFNPDEIVLLPLYPQFSTTTTGSSLLAWHKEAKRQKLTAPTRQVATWPTLPGWVGSVAEAVSKELDTLKGQPVRVLFSAHGLPKKIVDAGDPYQIQVETSVAAIVAWLAMPALDTVVCYQSKVGPLEWIGPSTDSEIERAGRDGVAIIVVPVAFVSEHSETLVELDIEYRHLAAHHGVPAYHRVATAGVAPAFISGLADLVKGTWHHGCGRRQLFVDQIPACDRCHELDGRDAVSAAPVRLPCGG